MRDGHTNQALATGELNGMFKVWGTTPHRNGQLQGVDRFACHKVGGAKDKRKQPRKRNTQSAQQQSPIFERQLVEIIPYVPVHIAVAPCEPQTLMNAS